jgi:hypothetical protein
MRRRIKLATFKLLSLKKTRKTTQSKNLKGRIKKLPEPGTLCKSNSEKDIK